MWRNLISTFATAAQFPVLHAACTVYFFSVLIYRVILALALQFTEAAPLGAPKGMLSFLIVSAGLGEDILLAAVFCLLVVLYRIFSNSQKSPSQRHFGAVIFFATLLFWNALILGSHLNLLFTMNTGFTWSVFVEFFTVLSLREFLSLMTLRDYIAVLLPPALLIGILLVRPAFLVSGRLIAMMLLAMLMAFFFSATVFAGRLPREFTANPHAFFLRDATLSLIAVRATQPIKSGNRLNVALTFPPFAESSLPPTFSAYVPRAEHKASVVVIILESTASDYIFDNQKYAGGKMPMPYLRSLADKSLWFTHHFASNNSSPRSIFSIFSGLYESPEIRFFSMEKKLHVPHLLDYLGKDYRAFLYTPADLDWYFPKHWFKNRDFTELNDYHRLKHLPEYKAGPTTVRDEFHTVAAFIEQLQGKAPYLAVYYSFVGHWPYPDLGPDYRLIEPHSSRDRYINNLYIQDKIIKQIVEALEASGKMQNTVLVIVGDHGEAFYQHPGNRVHSAESYNENIAAPLIIYAPGFVAPRRITQPTVHADIVPTLLDILGRAYNENRFQGESALRQQYRRKYIFSFGNENTLTAVSKDLVKMQILRTAKTCRHFDLKSDMAEQHNLGCAPALEQYRALEAFLKLQPGLLKGYNEICLSQGC